MINDPFFTYKVFLIIFLMGVGCGVIFELIKFVLMLFKNNKILKNILDFFCCLIFTLIFFFSLNQFNFGSFRLYLLVSFSLGFYLERKTIGKLIAKSLIFVYNKVTKLLGLVRTSKVGLFLFK